MGPARIYRWRKMRRSRAPSTAPDTFFVAQSWADCITNMAGFNLRQAQGDVVVLEHWGSSGFANTDLDLQLKQHGVRRFTTAHRSQLATASRERIPPICS